MALSVSQVSRSDLGDIVQVVANVTFDSSYPTGGESLVPASFGFGDAGFLSVSVNPVGGRVFPYDYTAKKLLAFEGTSQVANETDLHTLVVRATATAEF